MLDHEAYEKAYEMPKKGSFSELPVGRTIFFWLFLGPLSLISLFAFLFLFYPSSSIVFPTAVVLGLFGLWFFQRWGFVFGVSLLAASSLYTFYNPIDSGLILYQLAHISAFLSYLIIFLTLEEANSLLATLYESSHHHFQASKKISKEVEAFNESIAARERELLSNLRDAEAHLKTKSQEREEFDKEREMTRQELASAYAKQEQLACENSDLRQSFLRIEEKNGEWSALYTHEKEIRSLRDLELLKRREEIEALLQEKVNKVEKASWISRPVNNSQEFFFEGALLEEVSEQNYRKLLGMFKQLRVQFAEKQALLDQTRKELFHAQEEKSYLEREQQDKGDLAHALFKKIEEEQAELIAENEALRLYLSTFS